MYVHPVPEQVASIYHESYFYKDKAVEGLGYSEYDADKEPMRDFFLEELEKLERVSNGRNIFDVGAATGFFLDRAKERGWTTSGVEVSHFAGRQAIKRGHDVHIGVIEDLPSTASFDVVTMWDVLEHVGTLVSTIMSARKLLKPSGVVIINTPDAGSLFARILGKKWHLVVPPEHLNYLSRSNITRLLSNAGFEDIRISSKAKKFSLSYICQVLYRWQGFRTWGVLSKYFDAPFWRRFAIPINLHDNMLVVAKKKNDITS